MRIRSSSIIIFILFALIHCVANAQEADNTFFIADTLPVNLQGVYRLSEVSVVPFSESVRLRNRYLRKDEYSFSAVENKITISQKLQYSIFDTLFVFFKARKTGLKKEYKNRILKKIFDKELGDTVNIAKKINNPYSSNEIFGSNLKRSGTLIRGFTVGTTKDFTVSSGLRLQLSGKLSDDIEIVAALTDENTPIQPEGNTERLEELDKVFIEVRHKNARGTFGDFEIKDRFGEFARVDRKLQGLKGEFNYKDYRGRFSFAGSRGKFVNKQFEGTDGIQGPYRLSGINNEQDIIIIAGTEKVFLDGEEMKRGENNDYTIDYANSEITFTPNRLITSASRITIDYEYTDRQYERNFISAGAGATLLNKALDIEFNFYREGDDKNNAIDLALSDEDKEILKQAGDSRNLAAGSGVSLATPDSLGIRKGLYEKRDTLINGAPDSIFVYNPGSPGAVYNVNFTWVGPGNGDYSKITLAHYRYVGEGIGSYSPVQYLPLPERRQLGNINITATPWQGIKLNMELAGSSYDKNLFSGIDDNDNNGYARNLKLTIAPSDISLFGQNMGRYGLTVRDRFVEGRFESLDRINNVEFNRDYNLDDADADDETLREIKLSASPVNNFNIDASYGYLARGKDIRSDRYLGNLQYTNPEGAALNYQADFVENRNKHNRSNWLKQNGAFSWILFQTIKPGLSFNHEDKKSRAADSDSLLTGSHRYIEYKPGIELLNLYGFFFSYGYSFREESVPVGGLMRKQSEALTSEYNLEYQGIREIRSSFSLITREKKYTQLFKDEGYSNNETVLIKSRTKTNLLKRAVEGEIFYEAATQRSSRFEKVFVRVPVGTGNYIYLGDLNENGVADEDEFQLSAYDADFIQTVIPTDELFPVIDLKLNGRLKLQPDNYIRSSGFINTVVKSLSSESVIRIQENSKEEDTKKIYLLNFNSFLNDSTTIRGSIFYQQDINLFKNNRDISFRFRYTRKKSLNQYSSGNERGFYNERSFRINFRLVKEISNQTDITFSNDNLEAPEITNRARTIESSEFSTDFSYRPLNNLEVGFKIKAGRNTDSYPENPTIIDVNSQTLRFNLSFSGRGRLRMEAERTELTTNNSENSIPFEITRGNFPGKNYYWRVNFDYRITGNLQTTASYDGRFQGSGRVIHTMRAEARAYF